MGPNVVIRSVSNAEWHRDGKTRLASAAVGWNDSGTKTGRGYRPPYNGKSSSDIASEVDALLLREDKVAWIAWWSLCHPTSPT